MYIGKNLNLNERTIEELRNNVYKQAARNENKRARYKRLAEENGEVYESSEDDEPMSKAPPKAPEPETPEDSGQEKATKREL